MARRQHPHTTTEITFRDLEQHRGFTIIFSERKQLFIVTCRAGTMSREIPLQTVRGVTPSQVLNGFIQEHGKRHPAE